MSRTKRNNDEPIIVKKYANRRLYDTGRSSYVTLDDLYEMVKDGYDFVVQDAKTGKDITRSVLTQIIVEQETNGENLLPTSFLKQLIGFYGENLQSLVPNYLEQTLKTFVSNQEYFQNQVNKSLDYLNPVSTMEEMNRQNIAMFEKAMRTFSPFSSDEEKKS